jgi:drug/metabolite transporter (DMT)-like permease
MDWLRPGGHRPGPRVVLGVIIGFAGLTLLVGTHNLTGGGPIDRVGATVLLIGSVAWAAGSLYSRYGSFPESPVLTTSMQMITGSAMLLCVSLLTGEWTRIQWEQISRASLIAYVYLLMISSVAFTAYIWLLKVSTPARTSTHAYVNPVVAVFLGWLIGGEVLTKKIILAATIIVASVTMITTYETGETGDKAEPA